MKIIKIDKKINEIIVFPETMDDLWHLEKIIEKGDIVKGKTDRKIKPRKEGEKTIRQVINVEIEVENVNFQEYSENLKISGIIIGGTPKEFVELKAHQSIDIPIQEKARIIKKEIKKWHLERLRKAEEESATTNMLTIVLDDETAELAFVNQFSITRKGTINTKKPGKMFEGQKTNYFEELMEKIITLKPKKLLLAGPGFTKENLKKYLEEKNVLKGKIITETINSVGETGWRELVKSGKLCEVEKELQITKESKLVEEFLEKVAKEKADYGLKESEKLIKEGNAEKIIISETHLLQNREETEKIMRTGEKVGAEVHIISSKNPDERTIQNFGGITVIKSYKKR